jgi:hypothetical protein
MLNHQIKTIANTTKLDTKQPLPLLLFELESKSNNIGIFNMKKILNIIITVDLHVTKQTYLNVFDAKNMATLGINVTIINVNLFTIRSSPENQSHVITANNSIVATQHTNLVVAAGGLTKSFYLKWLVKSPPTASR